jgi:hypothetical protein
MTILTRSKVDEGGGKKYFKTGQKGIPRGYIICTWTYNKITQARPIWTRNGSDEIIIYHHLPRTVIVEKYKYSK